MLIKNGYPNHLEWSKSKEGVGQQVLSLRKGVGHPTVEPLEGVGQESFRLGFLLINRILINSPLSKRVETWDERRRAFSYGIVWGRTTLKKKMRTRPLTIP